MMAKSLENPLFRQRVKEPTKKHLRDRLREQDADEDYWAHKLGKAPKE